MSEVHDWATAQGFAFALLFGAREIYAGSGYVEVRNPLRFLSYQTGEWKTDPSAVGMVRALGETQWPDGEVDLRGPKF